MTTMQAMLGSKRAGSRAVSGRLRGVGAMPRISAEQAVGASLDDTTRALIHRRWRSGFSIEVLAGQFGTDRSRIEDIINEVRARHLLEAKLDYMGDPSFDDPAAVAAILGPTPEPAVDRGPRRSRAPEGLPPYLASLYEVPLLSQEQERHLFLRMNYLKYQAHQLRAALDPGRCDPAQLDEIERLQAEALAVKNRIISANLRLVVSIAKKHAGPTNNLFELISDGNMSLIRAVEKFDAARGFRFSTYASWAIMKNFARTLREEKSRRDRFVTGHAEQLGDAPDDRADAHEQESDHRRSQELVRGMLGRLNDRDRRILNGRYGIGDDHPRTLEQLGRELGVTKERVRQLEARAREKLREMAHAEGLDLPID